MLTCRLGDMHQNDETVDAFVAKVDAFAASLTGPE